VTYRPTTPVKLVGWLYAITGGSMLIAPFFAFQAPGAFAAASGVIALGVVVLAAGVGLLRHAFWAWPLAFLIALSGAVVVAARLYTGAPWAQTGPVLVTNLLSLAALLHARSPAPRA
jgi:anti-sigma factor RsiW